MFNSLNFSQSSPATSWVINHSFLDTPICDVMIPNESGKMVKILPASVVVTSSTQMTINFSTALSGQVRLVGNTNPVRDFTAGSIDPGATS